VELLYTLVTTTLAVGLILLLVARIMRQHNRPAVSIAWFLAIFLIPYIGVPAYLLFGGRKLAWWASRKEELFPRETGGDTAGGLVRHPAERILRTAAMPPARPGNTIELIHDGERAFRELCSLIEKARSSIHIMTFILGRDEVGGTILDLLCRKAREGVEVRLLLDALGCRWSKGRYVEPLRKAGGRVGIFLPVLPLRRRWSANLRNHRKIVLFDGETAMIGGMNLAQEYMGPRHKKFPWIDSMAVARGPVIGDLRRVFESDWLFATEERIEAETAPDEEDLGVMETHPGNALAQVAASGPDVVGDPVYDALLAGVYAATERIWIATPYFIPDEGFQKALLLQARLGRDVRVFLPKVSNHYLADLARGRFLRQLVEAGARVFFYARKMNHAKHLVFDDAVATVGSVNLDMRSLYWNYEITMFMYSRPEIDRTAAWMTRIRERSEELRDTKVGWLREWAEDVGALISPLL